MTITALGGSLISFLIDLPTLIVAGAALFYVGQKFKLERLSKITIGLLVVLAFLSFSALLYADKINCPYPYLCDCKKGSYCTDGKLNGSEFLLSLQPFSSAHLNPNHFPSLLAVFLFFLYPLALFAGYAFALKFSERSRKPLPGSYSREDVRSYARIASDTLTKNPKYSIVRYPDSQKGVNNLNEAIDRSIKQLHKEGIRHFVKSGDRVLIKVNICGGNSINPASFTSLNVVDHVVDEVLDAGAAQILICDADMIWTKFWPAIQAMSPRWDEWVKKKGDRVKLVNLSETELVYFDFGEDTVFQENEKPNQEVVSKEMLDADVIINIPAMKMHQFTSVTLGMKNMYGTLPKVDKFYYHKKGLEDVLYWVNWAFSPTLTIIDGSIGGEAWGPLDPTALEYKTIVASNNVVWADAMAAKLMGFESPFKDIPYLRKARDKMGEARSLLHEIPKEIYFTPAQLVSKWELPPHTKDGNWKKSDPKVQEQMFSLITRLQVVPGMVTFCNLIGDFIMWDASRLPLLKILQSAVLQFLYESPQYWIERSQQTIASRNRKLLNLAIIAIIAFLSVVIFVRNGYLIPWVYNQSFNGTWVQPEFNYQSLNSYIIYLMGFLLAIALSAFFAMRMKTRSLVAIILSSFMVGYLVESYAPLSWWWRYLHEEQAKIGGIFAQPPFYPLFVIPLFILSIIGLAHFISPAFACVGLKGRRFRLVPYAVIILSMVSYLIFEGYFEHIGNNNIIYLIYAALALLALHFNERNKLELNIALAIVAVAAGFIMEYFGAMAGYWTYPRALFNFSLLDISKNFNLTMIQNNFTLLNEHNYTNTYIFNFSNISKLNASLVTHGPAALWKEPIPFTTMPIFVSLSWALNAWAACGLALLFRMNMSRAFVRDATFDPNDPQAYIHRGDDRGKEHNYDKALTCYEKAIEMLSSQHEIDESIEEYYHPAVLNRPLALADAWYGKAVALASIGNFKDAKEAYEQSIKQYCEAYPEIPVTKIAHARHRKAVALQNLAFQDSNRIGAAQRERKDPEFKVALHAYDEALEACREALRTNPEAIDLYADIWIDKALMLQQKGEPGECLAVYGKAIEDKAFENYPHKRAELLDFRGFARIYQANLFLQRDAYDKAKEDFEKAGKLAKKVAERTWQAFAVWGGGCILEMKGQYSEAEQCFRKSLLDLSPKNPASIWDDLGDALLDQKNCGEALDAYETALRYFSDLENIEIEQAWRGKSLMLIKLVAHAWEGKGDSHCRKRENLKPEQEKLQKEKENLEHELDKVKQKQEQEDLKQEQKSLEQEQENLEHKLDDLKQKLEDQKQKADSQADLSFKAYRQAVECLDKLALDSDAMSSKGHVLSKMMRHKEALDSYDKAIKNSNSWPKDLANILSAKARIGKGNVFFDMGKYEEALHCYHKAMEAFPGCKPCLPGKYRDLEKIAGGEKGAARDEAAAIWSKAKEIDQDKRDEAHDKAAGARICAEAWQDREIYLSLMRYWD
jgi:uncharacterized protein (DUF362 family)/tetratricopeptide (TPR) repeat protein